MNNPANLLYEKTDEWAKVDNNKATIGITDYAQDQLSDIVFVEFTVSVGDKIEKGQQIATVESVKAAADINAPLSGEVIELNEVLTQTPEVLNKDPFGEAWLIRLTLSDVTETEMLMDADTYTKHCEERSH